MAAMKHSVQVVVFLVCIFTTLLVATSLDRQTIDLRRRPSRDPIKNPTRMSPQANSERTVLLKLRRRISKEMAGYEFFKKNTTLKNFVPEDGGQPGIVVIMATFRTGSNFLTSILRSHPGTYAQNEPLTYIIHPICSKESERKCIRILESALNCNYSYLHSEERLTRRLSTQHEQLHNKLGSSATGASPEFISSICQQYPFRVLKNVRLTLNDAKHFLDQPEQNIRVIHLVRDPRGIMHSRLQPIVAKNLRSSGTDFISSTHHLCTQMQRDYHVANKLRQLYPDRTLRYEDLCRDIYTVTGQVFRFLNWKFTSSVESFLKTHSVHNRGNVMSTFRNTTERPSLWLNTWNESSSELVDIERKCGTVMRLWGYEMLTQRSDKTYVKPHLKILNTTRIKK